MWTEITRGHYDRDHLRYSSDLTDAEWALLEPLLPARRRLGRPRTTEPRAVLNAILYLLEGGIAWRQLPTDFPPRSTVQNYFYRWRDDGLWEQITLALVSRERGRQGRTATPSAAVIDTQSVKTTESGGPRGFDAGKRVKGRKRHLITDTSGLPLALHVHAANVQDSHGAVPLLRQLRRRFPTLQHVFADRLYRGDKLLNAVADCGPWRIEIVTRSTRVGHFVPEPKRWVIERTLAWISRNRRLAKDFEASIRSAQAWLYLACVKLLTRRLARKLAM